MRKIQRQKQKQKQLLIQVQWTLGTGRGRISVKMVCSNKEAYCMYVASVRPSRYHGQSNHLPLAEVGTDNDNGDNGKLRPPARSIQDNSP